MNNPPEGKMVACPNCGTRFVCGAEAGLQTCWCMEKPTGAFDSDAGGHCFCPACLDKRLSERPYQSA